MSTHDRSFTCQLLDYVLCPKCGQPGLVIGKGKEWCQSMACDYIAPERGDTWALNEARLAQARETAHDRPR